MRILKHLIELLSRLMKRLSLKFLNWTRNLFWRTSSILIRTTPLSLEVRILPGNLLDQSMEEYKYKCNDIVYVLHIPKNRPNPEWPCLDSEYEIDCKIVAINTIYDKYPEYRANPVTLIAGNGMAVHTIIGNIIPAKEKDNFSRKNSLILQEDTELCPKGTVFFETLDYWCNDHLGIFIHKSRMLTLSHLFN